MLEEFACEGPLADVRPAGISEFGEEAYRDANPDINAAIAAGLLESAAAHFHNFGREEQRTRSPAYRQALVGGPAEFAAAGVPFSVDTTIVSTSGAAFVVGWMDDRGNALRSLSVIQGNDGSNTRAIARCRRPDVDALLHNTGPYAFGFWLVQKLEGVAVNGAQFSVRARLANGSFEQRDVQARIVIDAELRETTLGHFASREYCGNRDIEAANALASGAGQALVAFNRGLSRTIAASAHAEHYGPRRSRFKASLIICLFGKIEYFFLQNALFATGAGVADYEFVYVSNSPELAEPLQKEARAAELIYGLSITLVILPGNAGFGAANNAAARFARSDRLIFINPDLFPRDRFWAQTHAAIVDGLPPEQTKLFGAPLYYDDGSLMHGGMYFEVDQGLSVKADGITSHGVVRVEHYGKGAPVWSDKYTRPRPVPAVTGAFISTERAWFEALGGFTEDYIFGHYEDADLCLKSLQHGVPAWIHDIRFWHLEGKGSVRRLPHEGGSLVNRWLFTSRWAETITQSLAGRTPSHPAFAPDAPPAASPLTPPPPAAKPGASAKIRPAIPALLRPIRATRPREATKEVSKHG